MASSAATVGLSQFPSSSKITNNKYHKPLSVSIRSFNHKKKNQPNNREFIVKASVGASGPPSATAGLYSAEQFELTVENVDKVLENVRPYLIADGGNVDVVSVESGVVSLKLQGACGSCPSSTTTMKMGIERVLKEKFGDAIKDICQINDEQISETTVEAVNGHLDILRPAIKNFGGSVEVLSITDGNCQVKYEGPDSIGSGIKAAIKERFPDIVDVVFTN
ncbi:unnamed protein product [Fraxinus pennsylvanica]|uniref:NIF system FeS cluster assembly NifU C-terminal domain-containing protein n=1 Tax=Fraxinus pennsylvanica TaxID=56036 RepID=A0AAD2E215_9LAMI|nr:unnamed protein product [Fraxinus pennsylvanica]